MKESSSEPPKKKLKQARLPFQILSPPVVKNIESPPSQCKRKASDVASSDDDVVVSEINENKIKPVEKKAKVTSKDKDDDKNQNSKTQMEVEESEEDSKKSSTSKQKSKKSNSSNKKVNKTASNRKSSGKSVKAVENEKGKSEVKKTNNQSEVVDFIDLSDSPVKSSGKDQKQTPSTPKYKADSTVVATEAKEVIDNNGGSDSSVMTLVEDGPSSGVTDDNKKDSGEQEKVSRNESSDDLKNITDDESQEKKNPDAKCVSNDGSTENNTTNEKCESDDESTEKNNPSCPENDKVTLEASSSDKVEDISTKSKSTSANKKSPNVKSSLNQPSIKDLIISKSPKANSDFSHEKGEDKEKDNTDKSFQKQVSVDCSTPSRHASPPKNATETDESNVKTPSTANDSLTVDDSSPSSECNTSSVSTPGSDRTKKISKTPHRITPKQLLKMKEKEEKRKERERLKEEKEKKKAEEKEEKLKLKKEKEEERLKLKQEKEDEKRKEKEEKEKKKQAELDKKNEEKRLKEEEKRQKEEEKQAKEEEKRKKEEEEKKKKEEKRLKEEQKEAEKRKSAQAFASFFVKTETKAAVEEDKENTPVESNFQPFEVKADMRLAPLVRAQLPEGRRQLLDVTLEGETQTTAGQRLYLEQIRSPSYVRGSAPRTWPPPDNTDDEVIIIESEKPNEEMEIDEDVKEKKPEKRRHRAKLLQFHENRRPPYWGTWRKKSRNIRPRAPLNQDKTMLEYEVDSDDEWEEPGEGESLRGSDDDESQDEQYEEDNDMFVPHGYLSDGEGEDDLDDQSPESMKAKLKLLQIEFEAERNEKQEKLKPRLIGCVWFCNSESTPAKAASKISELFLLRRAVWEGSLPITVAPPLPSSPSMGLSGRGGDSGRDEAKTSSSGPKKRLVRDTLIPDIIKKMHGNRKKLSKLLVELLEEWEKDQTEPLPSKNCLAKKMRELGAWEKSPEAVHHCWIVKEDVRQAYGLTELDLPPPPAPSPSVPSPAANITKFTKVLTTDERLKLLRDSPVASKEAQKDSSKTPATPLELKTPNKSLKTPTVKLGTPSPAVKKRVPLITVGPKESPKQSTTPSIMNFVTKSAKGESETNTKKEEVKTEEKAKKRITPITLTTSVSKPAPPASSDDDCVIVLDE